MIEKILKEINRLKNELDGYSASEALDYIEAYINAISKEPASEGLEEAADKYALRDSQAYKGVHSTYSDDKIAFKAGAKWHESKMKETLQTEYEKGRFDMREEMMKDAVEGVVHHFPHDELAAVHYNDPKGTPMSIYVSSKGLSAGDRVKIIIVKEKEEK